MREMLKQHGTTILVAMVVAAVTAGGTAFAAHRGSASVSDRGHSFVALGRLAESHKDNNSLVGGNGTVRKTSITTPGPGYLMIVASSDVYDFGASDASDCWLQIGKRELSSSDRTIELDKSQGVNEEENCGTDSAWPVGKGKYLVSFKADSSTNGTVVYDESTLEVMYVPLNGRGKLPKPKVPTSVSGLLGNK